MFHFITTLKIIVQLYFTCMWNTIKCAWFFQNSLSPKLNYEQSDKFKQFNYFQKYIILICIFVMSTVMIET